MEKSYQALLIFVPLMLYGCNTLQKLSQVGDVPPLTQIRNPHANPNYAQVTMPMPRPQNVEEGENSLWKAGARSFFKDQRAHDVGDVLTIEINFSERANLSNSTKRSRTAEEKASLNNFLGYESKLNQILPDAVDPANLLKLKSEPSTEGSGTIARSETLNFKLAATVIQILPNGNLVVAGRQEIRVNAEVRELLITGIVRPQDILASNTVSYDKIAEARISYGGRGQLSEFMQPAWGQQILDILFPF